jgi:L-serine dehydratase
MAAGALAYLQGGGAEEICGAAAIALKSLLGLTCDPIGGLVEVPCVKRNVIGAVNAVTAADMVMAGVVSVIPADEVIDAMGEIGNEMPKKYKETAEGGLAITPTAVEITKNLPH